MRHVFSPCLRLALLVMQGYCKRMYVVGFVWALYVLGTAPRAQVCCTLRRAVTLKCSSGDRRISLCIGTIAVPTCRGTPACVLEDVSYRNRICLKGADMFGVWSPVCGARERHRQHDPDQCPTSRRADSCGGYACPLQVWFLWAHIPHTKLDPRHAPSSPSASLPKAVNAPSFP